MFSITLARAQQPPPPPALLGVWSYILDVVETAATSGSGWAQWQYLTAVKMLLQSPHNAVIDDDMRAALGDGGDAALLAMVKEGLLGLREPSGASCVGVYFSLRCCAPAGVPCGAASP